MSILDLHEREKKIKFKWNAPKYYDHPDGEDLPGKLSFVLKNATAFATIFGVVYANRPPRTNTLGKLVRIANFTIPAAVMGFTFTCVTYCSTVYRKKDDPVNHCLGGMAAGLILGPAMGSIGFSSTGVILFGLFAYLNKMGTMQGYSIAGNCYRKGLSTYFRREFDTSLTPEIKGNWLK